jgi:hypothetical protein
MNLRSIMLCATILGAAGGCVAQERIEAQLTFDESLPPGACADGSNQTECVIELRVEDKDDKSCRISLLIPSQDLVSFGPGIKDKFVYWRIKEQVAAKPYRFGLRDGIAFVDDPRPRNFVGLQRGGKDPTSFRARNKFNRTTVFKYVVNVTNETDSEPATRECSLDPWFRNR